MSLDSVRALALQVTFDVIGVPVTITRPAPDNQPVLTSGIWLAEMVEAQPFGTDFQRRDPRKVMAIKRDPVLLPNVPRGSTILAAELEGGTVKTWRVDGYERVVEPDEMRVIVIAV